MQISDKCDRNFLKSTCAGVALGAVTGAGLNLIGQHKILRNPDEFITTITGKVASEKAHNTKFFHGTQEAADLANRKLDEGLSKFIDFAKGGKYDVKSVLKSAGKAAAIGGLVTTAIYGMYKLCRIALKHDAKIIAEGIKEANQENA